MVKLLGINCQFFAPRPSKTYSTRGDLESAYFPPVSVGCIFQEYPEQKTLRKLGWAAELQEGSSLIHVPFDTDGLEVGALFSIPSGIETGGHRLFRVISMSNIMIYPASIACEIAVEYESTEELAATNNFTQSNFTTLLDYEEDD